jgi:hypothetical protein
MPPDSVEDAFRTAAEGARSEDDAAGDPEADSPDPEEDRVTVWETSPELALFGIKSADSCTSCSAKLSSVGLASTSVRNS